MEGSIFHKDRFIDVFQKYELRRGITGSAHIDPKQDFIITEALLNDLLTNTTLSTLSLGTWWEMTPVTTTRYRNTYEFSLRLNLIVPYSVCLAVLSIFSALGIWALYQNDMPVSDGGFLQIMMATRGDTEMEKLVVSNGVSATNRISPELRGLRIRYGKLVIGNGEEDGMEHYGFGTVEETVSLRKRK
jgi:hypothetical protein